MINELKLQILQSKNFALEIFFHFLHVEAQDYEL